ncbi:MAG: serine/threonine protein kinase [Myxococcaceae bacterium]|nr:serine/threonine protein kinase [Myxococcaceae bacterium]MCA3011156.1 serine/threonine protein kinase [Myxococcaceae bacterium]
MGPTGTSVTAIRDPLIGVRVLGYEIVRVIGLGGMGQVYEAVERTIGRRAAVKVLRPDVAERKDYIARLKGEARTANAVRHRGIIDVFGFAELPDGRQAIVMEYLDGVPLDVELRRYADAGRLMPALEVINLIDELTSVLSAAHTAGVVHRDLKPTNIFLSKAPDGTKTLKVLDFGIAKFDAHASLDTAANTVLGTPHYIAPEQAAGRPAAPSMDLYALGVIAFELFTGRLPFQYREAMALLLAHQQEAPLRPSSINQSLPAVVDDFVLTLLAKRPEARFTSAAEARSRLALLRRTLGDTTARDTDPQLEAHEETLRVRRARRRPWTWAAFGVGVGAALVLAVAGAVRVATRPEPPLITPPPPELAPTRSLEPVAIPEAPPPVEAAPPAPDAPPAPEPTAVPGEPPTPALPLPAPTALARPPQGQVQRERVASAEELRKALQRLERFKLRLQKAEAEADGLEYDVIDSTRRQLLDERNPMTPAAVEKALANVDAVVTALEANR